MRFGQTLWTTLNSEPQHRRKQQEEGVSWWSVSNTDNIADMYSPSIYWALHSNHLHKNRETNHVLVICKAFLVSLSPGPLFLCNTVSQHILPYVLNSCLTAACTFSCSLSSHPSHHTWHHTLTMPPFMQMLFTKPGISLLLCVCCSSPQQEA